MTTLKKLFEKMKSYSFWVSFTGALIIFLNCLGNIFGFKIENEVIENVIISFAGILVVFGLVTKDTASDSDETGDESEDVIEENEEKDEINENDE